MPKVFIDGKAGTTGLRIYERLENRPDIELITLSEELRKDIAARCEALNSADVVFLCLPDDAAIEAAKMVTNKNTVIIDTSTAHRTNDSWCYGFAELCGQREKIKASKRIANPGCHASGVISLVAPLTQNGIIGKDEKLSCISLTGYSGGGKKMIADYEDIKNTQHLCAPRMYGLNQQHKHLPEIVKMCNLKYEPAFCPIVSSYYSGMEVTVTLFNKDIEAIKQTYKEYYKQGFVKYTPCADEGGFICASAFSGRDDMEISVFGNSDRVLLVSRFDNLGKGASGAAIQNMNIILGTAENTGLNIGG